MKIVINRKNVIVIFLFLISIFTYEIFPLMNIQGGNWDNIRYLIITIGIIHGFIVMFLRRKLNKRAYFFKQLILLLSVVLLFYITSLYKAAIVEHVVVKRTYIELIYLLIPALYVFCLVNLLNLKEIISVFKIVLVVSAFLYLFIEIGITNILSLKNWISMSYSTSYSVFESSIFAGIFVNLFSFFLYFQKIEINSQKIVSKWPVILSFCLVIMTFKRLPVLYAIGLVILYNTVDLRGKVSKKILFLLTAVFTIATVVWFKIMDSSIGSSNGFIYHFTSGRSYILSLWKNYDYFSYGYGSSMDLIGRYLELDLIKIYLEIGIIPLIWFIFCYFNISKRNKYALIVMIYAMLNLLTASAIQNPFTWSILILSLVLIGENKPEDENIKIFNPKGILEMLKKKW